MAEETQRCEQRKERSSRETTSAPAPRLAASTSQELRDNPIELDPNPKEETVRRRQQPAATDAEAEAPTEVVMEIGPERKRGVLPSAMGANTKRRIAEITLLAEIQPSTSAAAITTQERVDGSCEQAMKIASVEQVESGNIMELSVAGHVLKGARQSKLSAGLWLTKRWT